MTNVIKNNRVTPPTGRSTTGGQTAEQREAMLKAAEKRQLEAETRGSKGGKLSQQLADQRRQNQPPISNKEPEKPIWD
ncbi:hypothetical protein BDB01DRAFT_137740 [Pilobolus umbonatus]|nr:hypothetical protein BDB01DRAFT_137740 [Pilobolus umbonatus]